MTRILHLPTTVGGNPQGLAAAERELGLDSVSLAFSQNYFQYQPDILLSASGRKWEIEFKRWRLIFFEMNRYDIIHYNFGCPASPRQMQLNGSVLPRWLKKAYNFGYARFLEGIDLKWMHRLKKVIAVTYQGDDARQGDYCRDHYPIHFAHEVASDYYPSEFDDIKRSRIRLFERYVDLIYALNPDLLNVLPARARFMPYASVDPRKWQPVPVTPGAQPIHIVHAPSENTVKGTRYLLAALDRLRAEGRIFRYTQVEGMSNAQAREVYETADLFVDQLLAGWYGGVSVELMSLAKPVICYIRQEDLQHIPAQMREEIPVITAQPDTIFEVLNRCLSMGREQLQQQGLACRNYVLKWHDPLKIAEDLKADYEAVLLQKQEAHRLSGR